MGALHEGHLSLMARARAECDVVVVSIFVNPLQFGDPDDIANYPRTLDDDLPACAAAGADLVFVPSVAEMYPTWPEPPATTVSVGGVSDGWEGASRPGHFDGVATVVAKLFAIAGPCRAYFGLKDFQQLAVVRRMALDLSLPVDVVGCPIVREPDGLALSSRNVRLAPSERAAATVLSRALAAGRTALEAGRALRRRAARRHGRRRRDRTARSNWTTRPRWTATSLVEHETVVDPARARLLVAARVGPVRLIDNCAALSTAHDAEAVPPAHPRVSAEVRQLERIA